MNKKSLARWLGSVALTGALVCSMSPAVAGSLQAPDVPAPAPVASALPEADTFPTAEPVPTAAAIESPKELPQTPVPAEPEAPAAADAADIVEEEAGLLGAHMGQGMERLLTTGDPQVPSAQEQEEKLEAEVSMEAPLQVPDTTAGKPPAATSINTTVTAGVSAFQAIPAFAADTAVSWMPPGIQGMDVSSHQQNVDWPGAWRQGSRFAYVKATEGTYYKNPYYTQQYNGSANTGMVRGAYHFAIPTVGSGAAEANYFVNNGGGWSADGRTLPPLLDIEYNPYPQLGNTCYNLSASQMITWIRDFSNTIKARTGRVPMIYSTTDWWRTCTGNTNAFSNHPLHIASYSQKGAGALPNGWPAYTVWQYSSTGPFAGDSNVFNGNTGALDAFARGANLPGAPAIMAKAAANPGLGAAKSGVVCGLRGGGCYQDFQGGSILWSPQTGAQVSPNAPIRSAYQAAGFENGALGYPTSGQVCGIKDNGCFQDFQGGAVLWSAASGAQVSTGGDIREAYRTSGFENGPLGYPTGPKACGIKDNGCFQDFQGGSILWSPSTGAQISAAGDIREAYRASGFENGPLGYPRSPNVCGIKDNGCFQDFQGGSILWSPSTGAHVSPVGPIRNEYQKHGFETGALGYPTGGQVCGIRNGGCYQNYQGGAILWSPATGAQASPTGPIRTAYQKHGFENGGLGYPIGGQVCGIKDGGCYQNYQGGAITWSKTAGAHPTAGEIRKKWQSTGFETGYLGYPTADETCTAAGKCTQPYEGGRIEWTKASGAVVFRK
ncbi:GH25 family lysozyme [Arthrobacter sp. YD2]|uniref:GH25 family lysozyme n=1 Tax=Arthrobacter sp. YD2 TaxID=3058046 RepID=UPI0025B51C43|nr:GH25 family lysozyme [Arthrobacter sp. YD2]MDN3904003.1 GH25 family lysozyme [Arthrobacter sp. YD2]